MIQLSLPLPFFLNPVSFFLHFGFPHIYSTFYAANPALLGTYFSSCWSYFFSSPLILSYFPLSLLRHWHLKLLWYRRIVRVKVFFLLLIFLLLFGFFWTGTCLLLWAVVIISGSYWSFYQLDALDSVLNFLKFIFLWSLRPKGCIESGLHAIGLDYYCRSLPTATILLHYIHILLHYFFLDMSFEDKLIFLWGKVAFDEVSLHAFSP